MSENYDPRPPETDIQCCDEVEVLDDGKTKSGTVVGTEVCFNPHKEVRYQVQIGVGENEGCRVITVSEDAVRKIT